MHMPSWLRSTPIAGFQPFPSMRPSPIKIRMAEGRRIPLGGQGREQADARAEKNGAADPAKGSAAPGCCERGGTLYEQPIEFPQFRHL